MVAKHEPTDFLRGKVATLAGMGVRQQDIATSLGITRVTLGKHYKKELIEEKINYHKMIFTAFLKNAIENNNLNAQMFYLARQSGWKENQEIEPEKEETISKIKIELLKPEEAKPNDKSK